MKNASLAFCLLLLVAVEAGAQAVESADPRVGLRGGWRNAGVAAHNLELVSHQEKPEGFFNPAAPGDFSFANADLAFSGNYAFLGGYNGFQVWDISNPGKPTLKSSHGCPGGQGDVSVYGDLLFMSVEELRGRIDCDPGEPQDSVSAERFRGVRIFDVSNIDQPKQVAAVQTCRGSHTHTLVTDPDDRRNVYIYVQGTNPVRPASELPGCSGGDPEEDPNTALFRIEVIQVPLNAPQNAKIINMPRIFAAGGSIAGLWRGGTHGEGTQETSETDQCHDITVYPEIGLAAGACSGNGILLDIRDAKNPKRIDEVVDPNFAYWHSATFNNDATTIVYTDEWGGGVAPRCRETDRPEWGANALFRLKNRDLEHVGYFKLPAAQTAVENCVAHNGSLIPVPGRDIMVQAWYQGGISVFDFTDPENPFEIAFFDRGPADTTQLVIGGYWSAYWYNGRIYGSEIVRGLDVFRLTPSEHLSQAEIEAAESVMMDEFNAQHQEKLVWPASFPLAGAYVDQLARAGAIEADKAKRLRRELAIARNAESADEKRVAAARLKIQARRLERGTDSSKKMRELAATIRKLSS